MSALKNNLILLVEDDHDIRVAVRQTLELANYNVLSAPNGVDALRILNRQKPDLIILDLVMPLMDGEEFLKAKERDDRLASIPVILISASPPSQILKVAPKVDEIIIKPLDLDKFLEKIPQVLTRKLNPA